MESSPVIHPEVDDDRIASTQQVDDRILKDVVAYVEVRTTNDNRSAAVRRELQLLGATVVKKFTDDVTHVVFKEGSNRTKTKAQKKDVHFVSVLWVDSCKQNQEHVSERMYPAIVPKQKGSSLFIAKLKKAKSMQPRDFEEEVSRSAERVNRKNRRLEALDKLQSAGSTPVGSPRTPRVLVQDTQPRSPDDGFVLTPLRLTIPDTPPSMKEKMKQLKIGKEGSYLNEFGADGRKFSSKDFLYDKEPLQRKLFMSNGMNLETLHSFDSPGPNSVFTSEDESKGDKTLPSDDDNEDTATTETECADENPLPSSNKKQEQSGSNSYQAIPDLIAHGNTKAKAKDVRFDIIAKDKTGESDVEPSHNAGEDSDSSVTDDILDIAGKINATINKKSSLDESMTAESDGFGSPGLKLDLQLPKAVVQDNQNKKNTDSNINETGKNQQEDKQSVATDSVKDKVGNADEHDSNNLRRKGKKSSLNISSRRKSRRISLQNVIDLIENETDEDEKVCDKSKSEDNEVTTSISAKDASSSGIADGVKAKGNSNQKVKSKNKPETVLNFSDLNMSSISHNNMTDDSKANRKKNKKEQNTKEQVNTSRHSDQDTSSNRHSEMSDDKKTKRKSNKKKKSSIDKQPDNIHKESVENAATVDNNQDLMKEALTDLNKSGNKDAVQSGNSKDRIELAADSSKNIIEGASHSEINESKTERKGRKSAQNRRKTHIEMENRGKAKTMPKKKLLSLTDLNDQHSVLIEPSKCSEAERPELLDKKKNQKQGGKRRKLNQENDTAKSIDAELESSYSSRVSDKEHNDSFDKNIDAETDSVKPKKNSRANSKQDGTNSRNANSIDQVNVNEAKDRSTNDNSKVKGRKRSKGPNAENLGAENKAQKLEKKQLSEKENRGRNRKTKSHQNVEEDRNTAIVDSSPVDENETIESRGKKRKSKVVKSVDNLASPKQPKKDGATSEKQPIRVDDTILADKDLDTTRNVTTQLNDITTQLNLTGNNSVTASVRDGTLSLSMSAVYNNDTTMRSILISSQRKSIDEFNLSQKSKKTKKYKSSMPSIKENRTVTYRSSSDSDNSLSGRAKKKFRPSIVMTSLHSHEQDVVISVVKKLGGFVIAENVNETTTHVICGEPRRTLNVLQCIARGGWLLNKAWVLKSLEAGSWIPEEDFECHQFFPVCKIARREREEMEGCCYKQNLFSSVGPIYVSGRSERGVPPRQALVQLIKLCGGQVTGMLNKASVYVGTDLHPGLTCLKTQWILECITQHRLLSAEKFSLDRPKREASPVY